jgi:hypothetical protein
MTSATRRARLILLALVAGCSALLLWVASSRIGPDAGWDYPDLAPPPRPAEPEAPVIPEATEAGDPVPIEVLLHPVSALVPAAGVAGGVDLRVESRVGSQPAAAVVRWLAGPSAPRTDAIRGATTVAGVAPGAAWLAIEGPGGRTTVRLVRLPRSEPLVIDWSRSVAIAGQVFDVAGRPLAEAEVWVEGRSARTTAAGDFVLDGAVAGDDVPVRIAAAGHASYQEIVRLAPGSPPLRFVLHPGRRLAGTVHVPAAAREGVRLSALPLGAAGAHAFPWFWPGRYCDVPVDAGGGFVLDGLPRDVAIAIGMQHAGYVLDEPVRLQPIGGGRSPVRIGMVPRAVALAAGRVLDSAERGMAGARVESRPVAKRTWGEDYAPAAVALAPSVRALGGCSAVTDGEGRFAVGLPWMRSEVWVSADAHVGQRRVVAGRQQSLEFELDARPPVPLAAGRAEVVVTVGVAPPAKLPRLWLVQVRWAGRPSGPAFRHDAGQPLVVPLGQPAIVDVTLRRPGSTAATVARGVRVAARTELAMTLPGT